MDAPRWLPIADAYATEVPAALAVREACRMAWLDQVLPASRHTWSVCDVGCGTGWFFAVAKNLGIWTPQRLIGVDIDRREAVRAAYRPGLYDQVLLRDIVHRDIGEQVDVCFANCSLEHIPDLPMALRRMRSWLKPGGRLITPLPLRGWMLGLPVMRWLTAIPGGRRVANGIQDHMDRTFAHAHIHDTQGWCDMFAAHGWRVTRADPIVMGQAHASWQTFMPLAALAKIRRAYGRDGVRHGPWRTMHPDAGWMRRCLGMTGPATGAAEVAIIAEPL